MSVVTCALAVCVLRADLSLELTAVRRDDAGFYQCVVNNSVAMDAVATATARLHVTRSRDHAARAPHGAGRLSSAS